jgi:hypothetical protein
VYSTLDGDLSRHADLAGFAAQLAAVAAESRSGGVAWKSVFWDVSV